MFKLSVSTWIGNAAAVLSGQWGDVSRRAREAECSRQTVYEHAEKLEAALAGRDQELQRLRDEN